MAEGENLNVPLPLRRRLLRAPRPPRGSIKVNLRSEDGRSGLIAGVYGGLAPPGRPAVPPSPAPPRPLPPPRSRSAPAHWGVVSVFRASDFGILGSWVEDPHHDFDCLLSNWGSNSPPQHSRSVPAHCRARSTDRNRRSTLSLLEGVSWYGHRNEISLHVAMALVAEFLHLQ